MRIVPVMLVKTPSARRVNTYSLSIAMYGSPFIVTVPDRQSLNSSLDDEVIEPDGLDSVEKLIVDVIDPPPGHAEVKDVEAPLGAAVTTAFRACARVVPMMPCVASKPAFWGGFTVEGADGEFPPHPAARPASRRSARNGCARMGGILPHAAPAVQE